MKKKIVYLLLFISFIVNLVLISKFLIKGDTYRYEGDSRQSIRMSKDHREFVMAEMRQFVESVQQINKGIMTNDPKPVIEAGKRSGRGVGEHAPDGLIKSLPVGFKKLGFGTHGLFDEISEAAKTDFNPKTTQQQLDKLLNNCVACHATYKIDVAPAK